MFWMFWVFWMFWKFQDEIGMDTHRMYLSLFHFSDFRTGQFSTRPIITYGEITILPITFSPKVIHRRMKLVLTKVFVLTTRIEWYPVWPTLTLPDLWLPIGREVKFWFCGEGAAKLGTAGAELPMQLVRRLPHQLAILPHQWVFSPPTSADL